MRAAVFQQANEPLIVAEVPAPRADATDLIIRIKCCGICGSDLHMAEVHDTSGGMRPLPTIDEIFFRPILAL